MPRTPPGPSGLPIEAQLERLKSRKDGLLGCREMPRLIGYFVLVMLVATVLQRLPGVGGWFRGLFGFYLTLLLVAAVGGWAAEHWRRRQRLERELARLRQVDTPHNQGKLGALLLAHGRVQEALAPLETALRAEPERAEWPYRLAEARERLGQPEQALQHLARVAALDPEYGYGAVPLGEARVRLALGQAEAALEALRRFELGAGPTPHSQCLAARALRALGRLAEARQRLEEVPKLYASLPAFRRKQERAWLWRARLGRC